MGKESVHGSHNLELTFSHWNAAWPLATTSTFVYDAKLWYVSLHMMSDTEDLDSPKDLAVFRSRPSSDK